MVKNIEDYSAAIARNTARLRLSVGKTQDELAGEARALGAAWTRATVAAIETGRRQLSFEDVVILTMALQLITDSDVGLSDLLKTDGLISIKGVYLAHSSLEVVLAGETDSLRADSIWTPKERELANVFRHAVSESRRLRDVVAKFWPSVRTLGQVNAVINDAEGEAERKLARRLGRDALEISAAAHQLWGQGLSAERDGRLQDEHDSEMSATTRRTALGHVSRALGKEVQEFLERSESGKRRKAFKR